MNAKKILGFSALSVLLAISTVRVADGRGCGGGFRGGAPGIRGGDDFDRSGFDRGFDNMFDRGPESGIHDYARPDLGWRPNDGDEARPDAFNSGPRLADDAELRANANHMWNVDSPHSLATDAGLDRIATAYPYAHTYRVPPGELAANGNLVRGSFNHWDNFDRGWWTNHPNAWRYPYYGDRYWPWGYTGWGGLAGFWGMSAGMELPLYDYGDNITYNNNEVYYNSNPVATESDYYTQAQQLADTASPSVATTTGAPATPPTWTKQNTDWKPLGVFSMTQGNQTDSTTLFQLAVDKNGIIRGNYANELTGEVKPVQGAVDKKALRAAWTVGNNKTVVYEAGVANLLKPQCTMLVHFSKTRTEQWNLVRIQKPPSNTKTS